MRRKNNVFIIAVMLLSMIVGTINMPMVKAVGEIVENSQTEPTQINLNERTNFNFIKISDLSDIEYTYEQNGKTYIVRESMSEDFLRFDTTICIIDDETEVVVEEYTTHVQTEGEVVWLNRYDNDVLIDSAHVDIEIDKPDNTETPYDLRSGVYDGYLYYVGATGKYYTAWEYAYDYTASTELRGATVAAVASVIINTVGTYAGLPAEALNAITGLASFAIQTGMNYAYWRGRVYEAHQVTYPARRYYGTPIGTYTFLELTNSIYQPLSGTEGEWVEWHDPASWPSSLTITSFSPSDGYTDPEW